MSSITGRMLRQMRAALPTAFTWDDMLNDWLRGGGVSRGDTAGMEVTHETALGLDAVFACIRLISATIATLPVNVLQVYPTGAWTRPKPKWMLRFNPETTWREGIQQIMASLLLDGNAFIVPIWNKRTGQIEQLWVLDPRYVVVRRNLPFMDLIYSVAGNEYGPDQILHIKALTQPGHLRGLSPIEMARTTLGTNIAAEKSASKLFENGLLSQVVITSDKPVSDQVAREMSDRLAETHAGAPNFWKPVVFGGGATVAPLNLTPEQSQFLESRAYGVESVSRWFGVPLIRIQQTTKVTSWGSGIEQINIMYLQDCISPNVVTLEEALLSLIQISNPNYVLKWNVRGLLRGDMAAQAQFYKDMLEIGAYTPNHVLSLEDENPFEGGDSHYMGVHFGVVQKDGTVLAPTINRVSETGPIPGGAA